MLILYQTDSDQKSGKEFDNDLRNELSFIIIQDLEKQNMLILYQTDPGQKSGKEFDNKFRNELTFIMI